MPSSISSGLCKLPFLCISKLLSPRSTLSEMSSEWRFLASDNIVPRTCIFRDANQQKLEVRYAIAIHRALFIPALPDNGNRIVRQ